jgi:mono/diheme cytochrome c family protein
MNKAGWFVLGALSLLGVALLAILLGGAHGFSARAQPGGFERWLAGLARGAALPAEARVRRNPVTLTPQVLNEARAHWADHCAVCHSNDGSGDAVMGRNMYPPAPDMRLPETQQMTDGELFYIIQNGVRLTGMPAWGDLGAAHDEEDSWKLVYFIRHLPQVTVEEKKEMEKLNPKGPDDREEEEQEQKFLRGEDTDVHQDETAHHHH